MPRSIIHINAGSIFPKRRPDFGFYLDTTKDEDWLLDYVKESIKIALNIPIAETSFRDVTINDTITYIMDIDRRPSYVVTFNTVDLVEL